MSGSRIPCARVTHLASAMLDGRLPNAQRQVVQRHLQQCPECLSIVRGLARLGRATHNLPPQRTAPDLGDRVQADLAQRRRQRTISLEHEPTQRRPRAITFVAAAALLALAWAIGFRMGGPTHPPRDAATGDLTFATTCRHVLGDLTWARLPQHTRRPLLAAQLELFGLPSRARRVLEHSAPQSAEYELASMVTNLAELVDVDIVPSRADVPLGVTEVVRRHAASLTVDERSDLQTFLELKSRFVAGGSAHDSIGFAVSASTASGDGLRQIVLDMERAMRQWCEQGVAADPVR